MSERIVTHRLSLDVTNQAVQATVTLAYGDEATHRLIVSLRHGAEDLKLPPGSHAVAVQENGADVLDSVIVYGPDSAYPNCIVYDITTAVTTVEGAHKARFIVSYMDELGEQMTITSPAILLIVKENVLKSSSLAASEPYAKLVEMKEKLEKKMGVLESDVDSLEEGKLGKYPAEFEKRVYTTSEEHGRPYSQYPTKYSMMWRNVDGTSQVNDPLAPLDIVNLQTLLKKLRELPDASEDARGMMTTQQVKQLATLVALLDDPDGEENDTIDKIREVLAAFETAGEDLNLVSEFNRINEALDKKIPKGSEKGCVYANDANGEPTMVRSTNQIYGGAIIQRDANGCAHVANPTTGTQITNKWYVDDRCKSVRNVLNARIDVESTRIDISDKRIAALRELIDPARFEVVKSESGSVLVPENALTYAAVKEVSAVFPGTGNLMPWTEDCSPTVLRHNLVADPSAGEVLEGGVLKSTYGGYDSGRCWDLTAYLMPGIYTLKADVTVIENGGNNDIAFGLLLDATSLKYNHFEVPTDVSADNPYETTLSINLNIDKKGKWYLIAQGGGGAQNYTNLDVRFSNIRLARGRDLAYIPPFISPASHGSFSIVSKQEYNLFDAMAALTVPANQYKVKHAEGSLYVDSLLGASMQYVTCVEVDPGTYTLSYDVEAIGTESDTLPTAMVVLFDVVPQKEAVNNSWYADPELNSHYNKYYLKTTVETGGRYVITFTLDSRSEVGFAFPGTKGGYKRVYNIQLNEGTVAYPYVAYPGKTLDRLSFRFSEDTRLMDYNPYYPEEHNYIDLEHQEMVFVGEQTSDGEDWVRYANEERVPLPEPVDNIIRVGYSGYGELRAVLDDESTAGHPSFTVEFQKEVLT